MNRITQLFGIKYPIIQGGMIWCSGWKLASSVSNAGGLGLIGSGSMYPDVLRDHILKCKQNTDKPFGVNIPLLYPDLDHHIQTIIDLDVKIVFTSAGSPMKYTSILKENGIIVVHVTSNLKFAKKSEEAGVDAVVSEGFEAGGHNGKEEITTLCLIPNVSENLNIPVIAAGGIASGKAMLAAMILGADGVQIGSRFVTSEESSAHINFKDEVVKAKEGDTMLSLKQLTAVRLLNNKFYQQVIEAESRGDSVEELSKLLGRSRAKRGMFEGDIDEGELEIGQVSSMIADIKPVKEIIEEIMNEFESQKSKIGNIQF
ncbi:MAG: nitronate monooxygenase [Flavobacteriales bacterium]|nr:nitronate monooxygenase [Flavobacteriales bacterium]|tara:strand:+ start:2412 stop:3356 length:945 start_codon:yes stop_codon:yes gene_type:complete